MKIDVFPPGLENLEEAEFLYRYLDRNGVLAFELRVPPEEYRQ